LGFSDRSQAGFQLTAEEDLISTSYESSQAMWQTGNDKHVYELPTAHAHAFAGAQLLG